MSVLARAASDFTPGLSPREIGRVEYVGKGIARVKGLPGARSEELLTFPGGTPGLALNIDRDEVGVILLGDYAHIRAGDSVNRTGRVLDIPVGEDLVGRVLDPSGRPLDEKGPFKAAER